MRKTKKYFREKLKSFNNLTRVEKIEILKEITKRYGDHRRRGSFEFYLDTNWRWNHKIKKFYFHNNTLFFEVNWVGDDTDGNDCMDVNLNSIDGFIIPAETFYDGRRTRTVHSDIRVTKEEINDAVATIQI